VNVSADGMDVSKNFRVKRIPDPIPTLSNNKSGLMSSGEFKLQRGVTPILENFDFGAECTVEEFTLVRIPKRKDPKFSKNSGGRFSADTKALVTQARGGDKYYFEDIKCKCPGDIKARNLGLMVFKIR